MRDYLLSALAISLTACGADPASFDGPLPSLSQQFECLPKSIAMISAHRGTVRGASYAENGMRGLEALIKRGYLMSEVDVAHLKDGTYILFHDGVWEEDSTGRGAVAASTWTQAEKYLLNDPQGKLTSETPAQLSDYLAAAKDKIYLEIDFKSSARYEDVIKMIRAHSMEEHVILIAYNPGQARKLMNLAPEMWVSVSTQNAGDIKKFGNAKVAAWVGKKISNDRLIQGLEKLRAPILGSMGRDWSAQKAVSADVLVTDYAFNHRPITGLTGKTKTEYENCLKQGR